MPENDAHASILTSRNVLSALNLWRAPLVNGAVHSSFLFFAFISDFGHGGLRRLMGLNSARKNAVE